MHKNVIYDHAHQYREASHLYHETEIHDNVWFFKRELRYSYILYISVKRFILLKYKLILCYWKFKFSDLFKEFNAD